MANTTLDSGLGLCEFQEFTASTRNTDLSANWKLDYSGFIQSEEIEFLTQHGVGLNMLLPFSMSSLYLLAPDETRFGMADELGDLIWFNSDTTDRLGLSLGQICLETVQPLVEKTLPEPVTFTDIGNLAVSLANKLKVPNKYGLMLPDEPAGYFSLAEYPGYIFMRSSHRIRRSLDKGVNDMSPPVASELEDIMPANETLGFNMLVLAYIAQARLGINIDDIAKFTVAKLKNRIKFGKENDIKFDETFMTPNPHHYYNMI